MPSPSLSESFRLFIDDDTSPTPQKIEVEGVESLSINPGKGVARVVTKGTTYTYQTDDGFSATAQIVVELPIGAGQALLWAAAQSGAIRRCYLEGVGAGAQTFAFDGRFAVSSIDSPNRGVQMWTLEISAEGDVTYAEAA